MLVIACLLVFPPAALGFGLGYLAGLWARSVDVDDVEYQPSVVLEWAHPERAVRAPIYQLHPKPDEGGAA